MRRFLGIGLLFALSGSLPAAEPPALINYQGVLRDSSDTPLNGAWHTIFRFFSAETGGDEILIDEHPNASEKEVLVSNGLFSVALGSGNLFDGSGPGVYGSLAEVFRDYGTIWLEVEIDGEVLTPRVRVISAAYALNADHLDGRAAAEFIDTSSDAQTKAGPLTVEVPSVLEYAVSGIGLQGGGRFEDANGSGVASLGVGDYGVDGRGNSAGGYFLDLDNGSYAYVGYGNYGIESYGNWGGGFFADGDSSGYAYVGWEHYGIDARGNSAGGHFRDSDSSGYAYVGIGDYGITAYGDSSGGYFGNLYSGSLAYLAYGDYGIEAQGAVAGGRFEDTDGSGQAYVGHGDRGISGYGAQAGGFFEDSDESGYAYVGTSNDGIRSYGDNMGGYFADNDESGYANVAVGDIGIEARGNAAGGSFFDRDHSGYALVGTGSYGIEARGDGAGGFFEDTDSSSVVWVGRTDNGISSYGDLMGGYFQDTTTSLVSRIAYGTDAINSTGNKNFVQNHPHEDNRVIVYSSLEGDEVGTYTRGTARLVNGAAEVTLGETFQWVTNPDIGLTVHLTPVGEWSDLYIVERSTEKIVVGSREGSPDVTFDYVVFGLRIGFEEVAPVREKEKEEEAYIPSMDDHREWYERSPEMRRFNALERFKAMAGETHGTDAAALDLSAANALRTAIQEYDPEIHGRIGPDRPGSIEDQAVAHPEVSPHPIAGMRDGGGEGAAPTGLVLPVDEEGNVYGRSFRPSAGDLATMVETGEAVEVGDVLVIDPERPGLMSLARQAEDTAVFGIVAAEPGLVLGAAQPGGNAHGSSDAPEPELDAEAEGIQDADPAAPGPPRASQVPVALSGIVLCKADAGYGQIRPGDLLTTSPTPGHAMRAGEPRPGTILGKALEPLDAGTERIRVLVTIR